MKLKKSTSKTLFIMFLLLALPTMVSAASVKELFTKLSSIDNPFELRDPFKPPFARKKISFAKKKEGFMSVQSAAEVLKTVMIENIRVVGVLVGKDRRAVVKIGDSKETLLVKEGMIVGVDKAELKAILPGGIVLVEKIKNIYDDDEYIETIIPLSQN